MTSRLAISARNDVPEAFKPILHAVQQIGVVPMWIWARNTAAQR